jgi:hypothetical protein
MPLIDAGFVSRSVFIPQLDFKFYTHQLDDTLVTRLNDIVLEVKDDILQNTPMPGVGKPLGFLTSRLWHYNLFDYPHAELRELKLIIAQQYCAYVDAMQYPRETVYIQCWANLLKFGQHINWHHHSDAHANAPHEYAYMSGNLCIHADNTKTYYKNPCAETDIVGLDNVAGEMVLFPSFISHETDKNMNQTPRISIAFDIITEQVYHMIDHKNFRFLL